MKIIREKMGVAQNLGLHDRILRFVAGCLLSGVPIYLMMVDSTAAWYTNYLIIISVYPFLTSIIGGDGIYSLFNIKSCGGSGRNQCGTLPYEIDAALGHNPIPENEHEHDLQHAHHHLAHRH